MAIRSPRPIAVLAVCWFLFGPGVARGDLLIFKDGFFLSGKVKQPRTFITDPASGASFTVPSGEFYSVEDGVRRIIFSPGQIQPGGVIKDDPNQDKNLVILRRIGTSLIGDAMLPGWELESFGNWNDKWQRTIRVATQHGSGRLAIEQRLTLLTPRYARVDSLRFNWIPYYFTQELGADTVRSLLYKFYLDKKDLRKSEKRLQIIRFLLQAGWLDHAAEELDTFDEDFPAEKSRVEPLREKLKLQRASLLVDNLQVAHKVGQHQKVQKALKQFDSDGLSKVVDDKQLIQVQEIKNKYSTAGKQLKAAHLFLKKLPGLAEVANRAFFKQASAAMADELNLDTLSRLERFLVYAEQFERELKQKRKHTQSADQVLALAISGWLLGNAAAEADVKSASTLWQARRLVLEYQNTAAAAARRQLADSFNKEHEIGVDVLARVIRHLPPPEPRGKISTELMKLEIAVDSPAQGTPYFVQLPPEYHPNRPYPVVFVLHTAGEKASDLLQRFSALGARHGYILVAPAWGQGFRPEYQFSPKEHAMVTDCLRDLRRRFQIDNDRVFLFGWRQGGTMAFDIGLSHPDQFAGVLPMCGTPKPFAARYWSNGQYLPFYAVDGDFNSNNPKAHRLLFKDWIRGHYPSLYVEYKGRGSEWFAAELPTMFDWMNRKQRANPMQQLGLRHTGGGQGEEFKILRESDNRFYWLGADDISPRCLTTAAGLARNPRILPATLQARIANANEINLKKEGIVNQVKTWNQINIYAFGVSKVTVWLGPKMIEFTKPVVLRVNSKVFNARVIPPSMHTMLEDFYLQGDRQRLYFAKIDINP